MLFLLPAYLSENTSITHFSPVIKEYIMQTDYFFVENEKTARKVVKFFAPEKTVGSETFLLDKYTENADIKEAQQLMLKGQDFGLLSEAGLPCIADPGNLMVKWCHEKNIRVIPISGPSSIILALISSGFNGQNLPSTAIFRLIKVKRRSRFFSSKVWFRRQDIRRFLWKLLTEIMRF
jgi:16S rRNA (cytidine1402-2'-O)-methyltransferase